MIRRPMKPYKLTILDSIGLQFPLLAFAKLDGIRCIIQDGKALSNSLKPIRNDYIRNHLSRVDLNGLDGELIVGNPFAPDVYRKTSSAVMSISGTPDFTLYVFDDATKPLDPYSSRLNTAAYKSEGQSRVICLSSSLIHSLEGLRTYEDVILGSGYEGVILRRPDAPYKHGRSTKKEGGLMALKRFVDAEAEVIGVTELMHNDNPPELNESGYTKRSSHRDNQVPAGTLGALICRDLETGVEFRVGVFKGYAKHELQLWWDDHANNVIGRVIKYKSFRIGVKDRPRHPVFLGWRDRDDMS